MRKLLPPRLVLAAFLLAASASLFATDEVTFVPWKVLKEGDAPLRSTFVLVWVPSSADDFRRSGMQVSQPLALLKSQCVGLQVVRPDDWLMIEKLGVRDKLPIALLVGADWSVTAKTENDHGALRVADVEKMVDSAIREREASLEKQLDAARQKAESGDRDAAIALYREVSAQRCAFPRCAREASRALRKLGVEEDD